ncbi:hypothetical protein [Armatimonas sp.]|uniref:hypothetical protein n=1 Tax=Armatimonas sp. TaxID=1872638 RepID=UPI0037539F45
MDAINVYADRLPSAGMTIGALKALDWVAPGQWENIVGYENMLSAYTGESDPGILQQVSERSLALFADTAEGYQRALWIYQAVDSTDHKLGTVSLAHQLGERFSALKFLAKLTPNDEVTQTVDLTVKIVAELTAFTYVNGLPGDSIGDFVAALGEYEHDSLVRMAALVTFDGLLPLGPEFLDKVDSSLRGFSASHLQGNETFKALSSMIPGGDTLGQLGFIGQTFGAVSGWIGNFVQERGLTPENIYESLKGRIDGLDGKMDVVAALIDTHTDYFAHTGTQSLCRSLMNRAIAEI